MIIKRHKTEFPNELIISHDNYDDIEFKRNLQLMKYCDGILNIQNITYVRRDHNGDYIVHTVCKNDVFRISSNDYKKLLNCSIL